MIKKIKKGFTLVELVVVIAIIAILSGVSVAVYVGVTNSAKKSNLTSEARSYGTVIRTALMAAPDGIKTGEFTVTWNDAEKCVKIDKDTENDVSIVTSLYDSDKEGELKSIKEITEPGLVNDKKVESLIFTDESGNSVTYSFADGSVK